MSRIAWLIVLAACGRGAAPRPHALPAAAACTEAPPPAAPANISDRPIARVSITGAGAQRPEVVEAVHTRAGAPLDRELLGADLRRLWALGVASQIDVAVAETPVGPEVELALVAPPRVDRVIGGGTRPELAMLRALEGTLLTQGRLARIAALAERTLQANGHAHARVQASAAVACGRATVTLDVDVGPRFRIGELVVVGSVLPVRRETLERDVGAVNVVGGVLRRPELVEDLDRLVLRHRARGWVDAKAVDLVIRYDETRGQVSVRVKIVPGERYRFGAPSIRGGDPELRTRAAAVVQPLRGQIYDEEAYHAAVQRVREEARARGYTVWSTVAHDYDAHVVETSINLVEEAAP